MFRYYRKFGSYQLAVVQHLGVPTSTLTEIVIHKAKPPKVPRQTHRSQNEPTSNDTTIRYVIMSQIC